MEEGVDGEGVKGGGRVESCKCIPVHSGGKKPVLISSRVDALMCELCSLSAASAT